MIHALKVPVCLLNVNLVAQKKERSGSTKGSPQNTLHFSQIVVQQHASTPLIAKRPEGNL